MLSYIESSRKIGLDPQTPGKRQVNSNGNPTLTVTPSLIRVALTMSGWHRDSFWGGGIERNAASQLDQALGRGKRHPKALQQVPQSRIRSACHRVLV